jgi:hypothetical protein
VQSIYIALDRRDLETLRDVVERAIQKTESLQGFLTGVGLAYFEDED